MKFATADTYLKSKQLADRWKMILKPFWRYRTMYLIMLPGMAYYLIYKYIPMLGAVIAFKDFSVFSGIFESPWANPWYKHFLYFFESPYFFQLLSNTLLISLYKILWGIPPGIILAILLNEIGSQKYKRVIQTVSYLPHFLSWVIIYGIVMSFFSENNGLINNFIREITGDTMPFLTSTQWFRSIIVGSAVWKNLGWSAIIYLAAISGLDTSLYEAAITDGATRLQRICHITIPGIRNVIVLMLILRLGEIMEAGFDQVYIMYNPNVYAVADIVDTWVYRVGLQQMNFSLASAVGLFKSVIGFALVISANKIAERWGENIW